MGEPSSRAAVFFFSPSCREGAAAEDPEVFRHVADGADQAGGLLQAGLDPPEAQGGGVSHSVVITSQCARLAFLCHSGVIVSQAGAAGCHREPDRAEEERFEGGRQTGCHQLHC